MLATPPLAAVLFLVPALPISIWVAWNDMARMKIPNIAVMALFAAFVVLGPLVLPLPEYGMRLLQAAIMLVAGFVMNMARLMGAGDAKFIAAMAPYVALPDITFVVRLFAAVLLGAFVVHRLARAWPAFRAAVPDWESITREDFPMGFALGGFLILYLGLSAAQGL